MADAGHESLFVIALARRMQNLDRVFAGANQSDVMLAACIARSLWAPRLRFWAAGTAHIDPTMDALMVGRDTYDNTLIAARGASFRQAHVFDDVLRAPVVFAGGIQVDSRGNANLAGVRVGDRWIVRGPGSAGLPSLTAFASRFFIQVPVHDRRSLVPTCALISVLGDPEQRQQAGLRPDALVEVITPLATFVPSADGLLLSETVAGVSRDALAEQTGFALRDAPQLTERKPVDDAEEMALAAFRSAAERNRTRYPLPQACERTASGSRMIDESNGR